MWETAAASPCISLHTAQAAPAVGALPRLPGTAHPSLPADKQVAVPVRAPRSSAVTARLCQRALEAQGGPSQVLHAHPALLTQPGDAYQEAVSDQFN